LRHNWLNGLKISTQRSRFLLKTGANSLFFRSIYTPHQQPPMPISWSMVTNLAHPQQAVSGLAAAPLLPGNRGRRERGGGLRRFPRPRASIGHKTSYACRYRICSIMPSMAVLSSGKARRILRRPWRARASGMNRRLTPRSM
jgi:hypothetical protein